MENKEEVGGVLILDKWSISFQTFPKVEAYADIANTSFEFPCSLEISYENIYRNILCEYQFLAPFP